MAFSLSTATSQTASFTLGFAFRQGDIPTGSGVTASIANVQVVPKSTWPDGSLRIAIVSGSAVLNAASALTVTLSAGTAAGGTALTTADLKTTGVTASVGCGSFGTVSWSGADWDSPFQTWVSGPRMSSWIYRKPVGSDAHLVAWLEVRLYAGGDVEVLPWVENGFVNVAGPTSKSATFSFTLGGGQRFSAAIDLPARTRTPLLSGSALSHWLGTDPGVTVKHDTTYLMASRLVPTYGVTIAPSNSLLNALPTTFAPQQQGMFRDTMSATGYHPSIGLLPQWDVLYLTSTSSVPYAAVVRQGYSAGRYASHYRDENTHRPIRFSNWPNLTIYSAATAVGTAPPVYDTGHHPSMGYFAYLVTGRFYFMEEIQFLATYNYMRQSADVILIRQREKGLFNSGSGDVTVRGSAWCVRTLAQAAVATADADPLRADLIASLEANIEWNHARYVAQTNCPQGIIQPYASSYGSGNGHQIEAFWQQDFYTAAFGFALAAGPSIQTAVKTKLQAFFAWKAQSAVGRLGPANSSSWLYADAANYVSEVAPTGAHWDDGTGPWAGSWGEMYRWNFPSASTTDPGLLRGGNFPGAASYWGNLTPAIAYAVEHGVSGALAAYQRMTGAGNYSLLADDYMTAPEWAVSPRT